MNIEIQKFGTVLTSRPAGREAYLTARAYSLPKDTDEMIEVDFSGVQVLTPSWADEFLTPLFSQYPGKVILRPSDNASVIATLEVLDLIKK